MTLVAYRVDCVDVADLRVADAAMLGCAWADLADRGMPVPSWRLAEEAVAGGAAAALVPSFAPGAMPDRDITLVFWRWARSPPNRVKPVDDFARLPRDAASWN